ncbi:MCP four helix bundle domain-containing protein [Fontibacillus panacisegetis]|uniref:MCP four helix bundle domain-containing protein n=1 Tax=Fontibacillus solani TaxID=1572857 RepID=UPI0035E44D36
MVIGTAGIAQIYSVNAKLEELNNSRLIPIVELEQIKSDMESTRSLANSYMDASDEAEVNNVLTSI